MNLGFLIMAPELFSSQNGNKLGISLTKMYWLLAPKSKLSTSNKLLIYKTILKPIWTYSRTFPIEILAHDSGRTLVRAEYGYPKGSPDTNS
jgi:hypothetical protein